MVALYLQVFAPKHSSQQQACQQTFFKKLIDKNLKRATLYNKYMKILNLTQHQPTATQKEAGVYCLPDETELHRLLTFTTAPNAEEIHDRAEAITQLTLRAKAKYVLLGGAPFLMAPLEQSLLKQHITPLYSFSIRQTKEEVLPNGSIKKIQIFDHQTFINNHL